MMRPMMPNRLTAIPTSTIIMRPFTLEVMLRLITAITKPKKVTTIPMPAIFLDLLSSVLALFPGFALHEQTARGGQQRQPDQNVKYVAARREPGRDQDERKKKQSERLRLRGIGSHNTPPVNFGRFHARSRFSASILTTGSDERSSREVLRIEHPRGGRQDEIFYGANHLL